MQQDDVNIQLEKAIKFFERADDVAATDNFDYAIQMYLDGIKLAPDALEDGHIALRRIALIRQGKGGKKPSVVEKMKRHGGKTPLEQMLNAEYLLAHDPDNVTHAETMLKAAIAGGYLRTAEWLAHLVYEANKTCDKPSAATYLLLRDVYKELKMYSKAVTVCQLASRLRPTDAALKDEIKELSAHMTMQKGNYGKPNGSFRDSIKDKDNQEKIYAGNKAVKSLDAKQQAVLDAKKVYEAEPTNPIRVLKYATSLNDLGTEEGYDSAINLLQSVYESSGDFNFKRKEGEIRIKKLKADVRSAMTAVKANPSDGAMKHQLSVELDLLNKAELEHYQLCVKQYPTELALKYDYALCLIKNKLYDQAIPLLQEAQRDPSRKIQAMDETGLCFFLKGWYPDAIDIFEAALNQCDVQDDAVAKDIRYNLARSYEEDGQLEKSLEIYRKLAQLDFGYKDVSQRVNKLRSAK